MNYQYIPYIWPLAVSALITIFLGFYAFLRRRNAKGAVSFILSMFIVTLWSSANALEMSGMDLPTKLFWANVQYIAYCYSPVTLLALCMEFTGYDRWIRSRKILWIAVLPTIVLLLAWTDRFHGLMRYNIHLDFSGPFPVIAKEYGPIFYIHALYAQLLNISAWILLIRAVFSKNTIYRKQALSLFIALSMIIIPNILYISDLSPIKRFDITPLSFAPAGLTAAWGIFRFKLFDVVPVAWATVIRNMDAGVMVLDLQDRVLDMNPALENIVGYSASKASVKLVEDVCGRIPELVIACVDRSVNHMEFSINTEGATKVYEVLLSPLTDGRGIMIGRLAVIYEITEKKQAQQEYVKRQWDLAVIKERERLARDLHDNLAQVLGFINFQTEGIRRELLDAGVEIAGNELNKLVEVTQAAHDDIREYISQARNAGSMNKNFSETLWRDIEDFEEQTGIKVELNIPPGFTGQELKPQVRINLLNIIREALNNIRKHAGTDGVRMSLTITGEQLYVSVEDDGKGFDSLRLGKDTKCGFGLNIMRERAWEMGAQIEIESTEGKGSLITLQVPLRGGKRENAREGDAGR